jgi:NifB/MoaA-like Fe-S oxidoreductase
VRAGLLRNRRGATSLRWLRALLDHGVEVHGQVVVCPGVNDGPLLDDTLAGVLDRYPELASLCVVPLGVSRFNAEDRMRPHTPAEARAVVDSVHDWQDVFLAALGRRLVFAADEYYLLAARPFPEAGTYGEFSMHEDGIGMARAFERELFGGREDAAPERGPSSPARSGAASLGSSCERGGFFRWADGDLSRSVDAEYEPYRTARAQAVTLRPRRDAPVAILTAPYGAQVLAPLVPRLGHPDVRIVPVENRYFGGNIAVSGLMVGEDLTRVLLDQPAGHRYLLPDVCLSQGRFLDGTGPDDLPHPVEVVPTSGAGLRTALGLS